MTQDGFGGSDGPRFRRKGSDSFAALGAEANLRIAEKTEVHEISERQITLYQNNIRACLFGWYKCRPQVCVAPAVSEACDIARAR